MFGRGGCASGVMRTGFCLLERHEARLKALHDAVIAGEQLRAPTVMDFKAIKARKLVVFTNK